MKSKTSWAVNWICMLCCAVCAWLNTRNWFKCRSTATTPNEKKSHNYFLCYMHISFFLFFHIFFVDLVFLSPQLIIILQYSHRSFFFHHSLKKIGSGACMPPYMYNAHCTHKHTHVKSDKTSDSNNKKSNERTWQTICRLWCNH